MGSATPSQHLEAIRARVEAATPGPWMWRLGDLVSPEDAADDLVLWAEHNFKGGEYPLLEGREEDKAFIAAAPEDIRFLLGEVERLSKAVAKWDEHMPIIAGTLAAIADAQDDVSPAKVHVLVEDMIARLAEAKAAREALELRP